MTARDIRSSLLLKTEAADMTLNAQTGYKGKVGMISAQWMSGDAPWIIGERVGPGVTCGPNGALMDSNDAP